MSGLEVRVSYFGFCLMLNSSLSACSNDIGALQQSVDGHDPLNLMWMAKKFHDETIFSGLIFIAIIFAFACVCLLLVSFPSWHREYDSDDSEIEVKPFPSRQIVQASLGIVSIAALLGLISALWQHLSTAATTVMVKTLTYNSVVGHVGTAAMVLGWVGAAIFVVVALGIVLIMMSLKVLAELAD
ncbi:Uncharacterized protein SAPIO_CDS8228 [Scedosporium apiospermum]|uniref:Uncharacterized protein n=1 Tax=Pseudallescheria apiosperma TaxID=563466 RepID=A0A084FZ62_PSEDA|nr:Uncharacterized protein SAPIO_CDS8228 [Scedosporium apiospermum]KEZ40374.1 Uncharacterized protein SAPIO_CDS8228 [Scedosporium apiospermum]